MQILQLKLAAKTIKSKYYILTVTTSFILSILVLAYFLSFKEFSVFPNHHHFQYVPYNDNAIGGTSAINEYAVTDSLIKITFRLNNIKNISYVGISLSPKNNHNFNLAHYNLLNIEIKSKGISNLGMSFYMPNSNSTNKEIVTYTSIPITNIRKLYSVPFNQFKVPFWWFEVNNLNNDYDIQPGFENILCLNICNAYTSNIDENKTLELYSLTFTRNNKPLILLLLAINFFLSFLSFFIILIINKTRDNKNSVTITYKAIESNFKVASKSDIISFINNNFHKSELTLEMVSAETGVSQRKITNLIQQHFTCNFKTYLNHLRINESKRLLVETGLNIGEIAFKVGFNNQSHFNRVFKTELNKSPSEYRDKNSK